MSGGRGYDDATCEFCGKSFKARRDLIKIGGGRFCSKSCSNRTPLPPQFVRLIEIGKPVVSHWSQSACVDWEMSVDRGGYGRIKRVGMHVLAHRAVWEAICGPIENGMVIDHLCRNRRCVNVAHMELVSGTENVLRGEGPTAINARKTHCKRGHLLPQAHNGKRECIECRN